MVVLSELRRRRLARLPKEWRDLLSSAPGDPATIGPRTGGPGPRRQERIVNRSQSLYGRTAFAHLTRAAKRVEEIYDAVEPLVAQRRQDSPYHKKCKEALEKTIKHYLGKVPDQRVQLDAFQQIAYHFSKSYVFPRPPGRCYPMERALKEYQELDILQANTEDLQNEIKWFMYYLRFWDSYLRHHLAYVGGMTTITSRGLNNFGQQARFQVLSMIKRALELSLVAVASGVHLGGLLSIPGLSVLLGLPVLERWLDLQRATDALVRGIATQSTIGYFRGHGRRLSTFDFERGGSTVPLEYQSLFTCLDVFKNIGGAYLGLSAIAAAYQQLFLTFADGYPTVDEKGKPVLGGVDGMMRWIKQDSWGVAALHMLQAAMYQGLLKSVHEGETDDTFAKFFVLHVVPVLAGTLWLNAGKNAIDHLRFAAPSFLVLSGFRFLRNSLIRDRKFLNTLLEYYFGDDFGVYVSLGLEAFLLYLKLDINTFRFNTPERTLDWVALIHTTNNTMISNATSGDSCVLGLLSAGDSTMARSIFQTNDTAEMYSAPDQSPYLVIPMQNMIVTAILQAFWFLALNDKRNVDLEMPVFRLRRGTGLLPLLEGAAERAEAYGVGNERASKFVNSLKGVENDLDNRGSDEEDAADGNAILAIFSDSFPVKGRTEAFEPEPPLYFGAALLNSAVEKTVTVGETVIQTFLRVAEQKTLVNLLLDSDVLKRVTDPQKMVDLGPAALSASVFIPQTVEVLRSLLLGSDYYDPAETRLRPLGQERGVFLPFQIIRNSISNTLGTVPLWLGGGLVEFTFTMQDVEEQYMKQAGKLVTENQESDRFDIGLHATKDGEPRMGVWKCIASDMDFFCQRRYKYADFKTTLSDCAFTMSLTVVPRFLPAKLVLFKTDEGLTSVGCSHVIATVTGNTIGLMGVGRERSFRVDLVVRCSADYAKGGKSLSVALQYPRRSELIVNSDTASIEERKFMNIGSVREIKALGPSSELPSGEIVGVCGIDDRYDSSLPAGFSASADLACHLNDFVFPLIRFSEQDVGSSRSPPQNQDRAGGGTTNTDSGNTNSFNQTFTNVFNDNRVVINTLPPPGGGSEGASTLEPVVSNPVVFNPVSETPGGGGGRESLTLTKRLDSVFSFDWLSFASGGGGGKSAFKAWRGPDAKTMVKEKEKYDSDPSFQAEVKKWYRETLSKYNTENPETLVSDVYKELKDLDFVHRDSSGNQVFTKKGSKSFEKMLRAQVPPGELQLIDLGV